MKRLVLVGALLGMLPLCGLAAGPRQMRPGRPALTLAQKRPLAAPNQFVVKYAPGTRASAAGTLNARAGARVISSIPQLGVQTVQLGSPAAAALYRRSPGVQWVEPNAMRYAMLATPNDPKYNEQDSSLPNDPADATWYEWDARLMQCEEGWALFPNRYFTAAPKGSAGVRIAIIDTGIDYGHPDFKNAGAATSNVSDGGQLERALDRTIESGVFTPEAWDAFGHGVHVTGIAAAATNNATGVTGVGYNSNIMSLRVLNAAGEGTESDIAAAIVYAADNGALICNLSLGGYQYSQVEQDAVDYAWNRGTLCIAAAGNDGVDTKPNYPAALTRVLAVSATAREERLALYSNYGEYVGLCAPGGDFDFIINWFLGVYSTMPTYEVTMNGADYGMQMNYDYAQGTSMAAPQVTGLAALYAAKKGYTQSTPGVCLKIWQALQRGAEDITGGGGTWNPYYGHGRVNVYQTLNLDSVPNPRGVSSGGATGQVRFRDTPVANAVVRFNKVGSTFTASTNSRADGGFRGVNLLAGAFDITATVFGESLTMTNVPVTAGCDIPGIVLNVGGLPSPTSLAATVVSSTKINLAWTDNSGSEDGFKIERKIGAGSFAPLVTVAANVTSYSNAFLTPNTEYTYRIKAFQGTVYSGYAVSVPVTTPDLPATPSGLVATAASSTRVNLAWTDNATDEDGYKIEKKTGSGGSFGQIAKVTANTTSYTNIFLTPGTEYSYRVRAYRGPDHSAYATSSPVTTPALPGTPTNLTATVASSTRINLAWTDNATDENGFSVERKVGTAGFFVVNSVPANTTTYASVFLQPDTQYTYRVRAYRGPDYSGYATSPQVKTFAMPAAPTNVTATAATRTRVVVNWTDVATDETGYKIEKKTGTGAFIHIVTVGANVTSYTNNFLDPNTQYQYRVRAYRGPDHSAYGTSNTVTTPP